MLIYLIFDIYRGHILSQHLSAFNYIFRRWLKNTHIIIWNILIDLKTTEPLKSESSLQLNGLFQNISNLASDVAIHLTLPHTSGWVWYKGLDFYFLTPPPPHFERFVLHFSCSGGLLIMYTKFGWVCSNGLDFYFLTPSTTFGPRKKYFRYYRLIL